ncbi:MAG TPA: hypothetical protein VIH56_06755 [Candidatus Acidoferrales bacterium]
MARLSDFQPVADARIALDPKLISHNTFDAGNSVDWEKAEIGTPKGGTLGGHDDPFAVIERIAKREIAMDKDHAYRKRMHAALDRAMDAAEENPEPAKTGAGKVRMRPADDEPAEADPNAEPEESDDSRSRMHKMLDALMDGEFSIPAKPSKVVAKDRSYGKDSKPSKICCFDCGNLDGVKGEAHVQKVI